MYLLIYASHIVFDLIVVFTQNNCGITCSATNSVGLSENILKMSKMPSMDLKHIGENSYNCYKKYFDRKMLYEKA